MSTENEVRGDKVRLRKLSKKGSGRIQQQGDHCKQFYVEAVNKGTCYQVYKKKGCRHTPKTDSPGYPP